MGLGYFQRCQKSEARTRTNATEASVYHVNHTDLLIYFRLLREYLQNLEAYIDPCVRYLLGKCVKLIST